MAVRSLTSKPQSFLPPLNLHNGSISHLLPFGGGLQKKGGTKGLSNRRMDRLGACVNTEHAAAWCGILHTCRVRQCFHSSLVANAFSRAMLYYGPSSSSFFRGSPLRFFLTFFLLSEEKSSSFSSPPSHNPFSRNSAFFFPPHLHKKRRGEEALEKGRGRWWRRERGEGKGGE